METNLNGIVLDGKFYKAEEQDIRICAECDLYLQCTGWNDIGRHAALLSSCLYFGKENIFLYSPELTEKLKGE